MAETTGSKTWEMGGTPIQICASRKALGTSAAQQAAQIIQRAVAARGRARIIIATGNSQIDFIDALTRDQSIDWGAVEVFHMDEYVGIGPGHPASFRFWIRTRIEQRVHPACVHYIAADASDLDAEMDRYSKLLTAGPIDLAFVGFGENGHIAFNDPHVANFDDPAILKRVTLDEACRRQQAGEGHFKDAESVPKKAVTITCSGLFRAAAWICCVPELRKAEAVRSALEGPVSSSCPASIVRRHPNARVYLDAQSASLLSPAFDGNRVSA